MKLYHGGVPNLMTGEVLTADHARRHHEGCPICEARSKGQNPAIDPLSAQHGVYVSESREYARYYASLYGSGDLYLIKPIGDLRESAEEKGWRAWVCERAKVLKVIEHRVTLTMPERRRLYLKWALKDGNPDPVQAEHEFREMVKSARAKAS